MRASLQPQETTAEGPGQVETFPSALASLHKLCTFLETRFLHAICILYPQLLLEEF